MRQISDDWFGNQNSFTDIPIEPNELAIPFAIQSCFLDFDYVEIMNLKLTQKQKKEICGFT